MKKKLLRIFIYGILVLGMTGCSQEKVLSKNELSNLQEEITDKVVEAEYHNFASCYVDVTAGVVVVELTDNSTEQQEWFRENIIDSKYIKFEQGGPYTTSNLDKVYNNTITKDYSDIRNLSEKYSIDEAKKDNCFVVGEKVYNDYLYTAFMEKYNNKENVFIRVVQTTIEGDLIIYDIFYQDNQLFLVTDNTRDEFSVEENRKIELKEYKNIGIYEYKDRSYWILYNTDEVTDIMFENGEIFVVTTIN